MSACMWLGFAPAGAVAQAVTGSGTSGTAPVFNGTTTVTNSHIAIRSTYVGIGTTLPIGILDVALNTNSSWIYFRNDVASVIPSGTANYGLSFAWNTSGGSGNLKFYMGQV